MTSTSTEELTKQAQWQKLFNKAAREVPSPFTGRDESAVPYLGQGWLGFHFPMSVIE